MNGNYTGGGGSSGEATCGSASIVTQVDSRNFLFYDGHPGYDYPFPFTSKVLTGVFPAVSGCVSYQIAAAGGAIVNQANYHVLAIVPSSAPQPNGCQAAASLTRVAVFYLHLAPYVGSDGKTMMVCPSPPKNGSTTCPSAVPCSNCPVEGTWVSADPAITKQPIAYVGNFAYNPKVGAGVWGGVGPHLHFEVDYMPTPGASLIPLDPYGWYPITPGQKDPYSPLPPGLGNTWLWQQAPPY